jgi:hypothetical protein
MLSERCDAANAMKRAEMRKRRLPSEGRRNKFGLSMFLVESYLPSRPRKLIKE